jgi:hypothetical protein
MENSHIQREEGEKNRSSYSRGRGGRRSDRDRDSYGGRDELTSAVRETPPNPKPNVRDSETSGSSPILHPSTSPISDTKAGPKPIRPPPPIDASRVGWSAIHAEWCEHGCSNENIHYSRWRDAYDSHIWDLYSTFSNRINSSKVSFNLFAEFVYLNSSGYISEFA